MPTFLDSRHELTMDIDKDSMPQEGLDSEELPRVRQDSLVEMRLPMPSTSQVKSDGMSKAYASNHEESGLPRTGARESHVVLSAETDLTPAARPSVNARVDTYTFVLEVNPAIPRSKAEKRAIRQAVMNNHLHKAALSTNKRRKTDLGPTCTPSGVSLIPLHASQPFPEGIVRLTPASTAPSTSSSCDDCEGEAQVVSHNSTAEPPPIPEYPVQTPPLWNWAVTSTPYLVSSLNEIPFPSFQLGNRVDSFDTWPQFSDARVNVGRLKYICSLRFGSRRLSNDWVPALLKSRHAFLSTICISAAHDDIMRRHSTASADTAIESYERIRVRHKVINMVNASISNPEERFSDGTIIAVLHLLNAEVMNGNLEVLNVHIDGLTRMVNARGGLDNGMFNKYLPGLITVTMYLIAVLHENLPNLVYRSYAAQQNTRPPVSGKMYPENPMLCGNQYVWPESKMYHMLDLLREMTRVAIQDQPACRNRLERCQRELLAVEPGSQHAHASAQERQYEVVRLTGLLFARAIMQQIPLSYAEATGESGLVVIMQALSRTCLDTCWDHLTGVLFWVVLVAGAAAHQPKDVALATRSNDGRFAEEDARRYLAAVAVRCSVVLGFEHGSAVLGTLKSMVELQQLLRGHGMVQDARVV